MVKENKKTEYISGTFLLKADAAFINGAGLQTGEDQNISVPKTMWKNGLKIPYVSSQAWKHMWRQTLIEETKWDQSNLRAIGWNAKGNTNKIAGMLDPINYREDDIFGYMYALSGKKDKKSKEGGLPKEPTDEQKAVFEDLPDIPIIRASTILASLLYSIQPTNTVSTDNAFIHLKDETPLPYSTKFYNTDLNAIFGIDYSRIGIYDNLDNIEVNPAKIKDALANKSIEVIEPKDGNIKTTKVGGIEVPRGKYGKVNLEVYKQEIVYELLNALSRLRGGAKATQFGVDIAPKAMIIAGLASKNPFLNNLFTTDERGNPELHIDLLKELIKDYSTRITTKVYIGIRKGYLKNEGDILKLNSTIIDEIELIITTPNQIAEKIKTEL